MQRETIVKFAKQLDSWLATNSALLTLMGVASIFAICQIIMFFTGDPGSVATYSDYEWKAWVYLISSILTIYFGIMFSASNVRGSKYFLFWNVLFMLASIVLQILGFSIMALVSLLYGFFSSLMRQWLWTNNTIEKWGISKKQITIGIIIFGIVMLIILNTLAATLGTEIYGDEEGSDWTRFTDATGGALEITGYTALIFRSNWAFLSFVLCKVSYIIFWIAQGNIVTTVQMIIFGLLDISGLILWTFYHTKEKLTNGMFTWDENGKPVLVEKSESN